MNYDCSYDGKRWAGEITRLKVAGDIFFAHLTGRSSGIDIICGRDPYGANFICMPNHDAGCPLASLSDTFWNKERMAPLIGDVDAVTVANGIRLISQLIKEGRISR